MPFSPLVVIWTSWCATGPASGFLICSLERVLTPSLLYRAFPVSNQGAKRGGLQKG
jgi:hypothetical protein